MEISAEFDGKRGASGFENGPLSSDVFFLTFMLTFPMNSKRLFLLLLLLWLNFSADYNYSAV